MPQLITFIDIAMNRRFDEAALKQAKSASDAVRAHYAGCMKKLLCSTSVVCCPRVRQVGGSLSNSVFGTFIAVELLPELVTEVIGCDRSPASHAGLWSC